MRSIWKQMEDANKKLERIHKRLPIIMARTEKVKARLEAKREAKRFEKLKIQESDSNEM